MSQNTKLRFFSTGDKCRIAYQLDGPADKPVLVLSNSIATGLHMWDDQMPAFTKHFRVLRFDTRGNGASDAPKGDYSVDRMGLDLIELLDTLHIRCVHFCGLSLGGFIGQWLGVHAPERVDKLILVNTSAYLGPSPTWNTYIHALRHGGRMQPFADMFIGNWFPADYNHQHAAVVAKFRAMVLATRPDGLAGSFAAVRDADLRRSGTIIPNKTLIIGGTVDKVTLPAHSEAMAKQIPYSTLVLLPVVHLSNVEASTTFEKNVLHFLLSP